MERIRLRRQLKMLEIGIVFVLLASVFVALFGLFVKLGTTFSSISGLVFLRFFVPFLFVASGVFFIGGYKVFRQKTDFQFLWFRALFEVLAQFCLFFYLAKGNLLSGILLWNTGPLFIPIFSFFFLRHRIDYNTWVAILIGMIGVGCIIKPDQGIIDQISLIGLMAGLSMGISQVIFGVVVRKFTTTETLFYIYGMASILCAVILVIEQIFFDFHFLDFAKECLQCELMDVVYVVLISVCSIISQALRGWAYKFSKPANLAPFFYFSVIVAGFLDWLVFGKIPTFTAIIGSLLIILASFVKWNYSTKSETG